MSLDYSFLIANDAQPDQVLNLLSKSALGLERDTEGHWLIKWSAEQNPILLVASVSLDDYSQEIREEFLGFRPSLLVGFTPQPDNGDTFEEDSEVADRTMRDAVILLLRNLKGNAAFLFNGDQNLLQRTAEKLVFDRDWWEASLQRKLEEVA